MITQLPRVRILLITHAELHVWLGRSAAQFRSCHFPVHVQALRPKTELGIQLTSHPMTPANYNKLNVLLSEYSVLSAALEAAEAEIKTIQLAAAQELLPKHAAAKVALANLEGSLRALSDQLYTELFPDDKRSHKTPFGEVKYTKSSSLEFDDPEKVALKIDAACDAEEAYAARDKRAPAFTAEQLLRTRVEPDLEALEKLSDGQLHLFGITRIQKDNFKVVPFAMKTDKPAKKKEAA